MLPFRMPPAEAQRGVRRADATLALVGLVAGLLFGSVAAWPLSGGPFSPTPQAGASALIPAGSNAERVAIRRVQQVARAATVRLSGNGCLGRTAGTGVRVGPRRVLTAAHVVAGESVVEVRGVDGRRRQGNGITRLGPVDAALVTTPTAGRSVSVRRGRVLVGERVVVAGSPNGGAVRTRAARVTGQATGLAAGDPPSAVVLDVIARPGDSGGPVLDLSGRLVGIVYARATSNGRALVIPVDSIDLAAPGTPGVPC